MSQFTDRLSGLTLFVVGLFLTTTAGAFAQPQSSVPPGTPGQRNDFPELRQRFEDHRAKLAPLEQELANDVALKLLGNSIETLPPQFFHQRLQTAATMLGTISDPNALGMIYALTRNHPHPAVRAMLLDIVEKQLPETHAAQLVVDLIHDNDDIVAFKAIRIAGKHRLSNAADDLIRIGSSPSATIHTSGKPVGVGAALVIEALMQILGSHDYQELARRERMLKRSAQGVSPTSPLRNRFIPSFEFAPNDFNATEWKRVQYRWYAQLLSATPDGRAHSRNALLLPYDTVKGKDGKAMVRIPAGSFFMGLPQQLLPAQRFVFSDYTEPRPVYLDEYYIDVYPVTNEEYDRFVSAVSQEGHKSCHPDEVPQKRHIRNTIHDRRFAPDHPVAGIDWYDAWAYCNWAGKELPTEQHWEKAARGTDGRLYPWGNEWAPSRVRYAETVWGVGMPTVAIWRDNLREVSESFPTALTRSVYGDDGNVSPFGVREAIGNVWEWTKTNYFTRDDMVPHFKQKRPTDFMNDRTAFPVIRGGAWSSIPEMLTTVYRGKDLLTDRHNEIGFRGISRSSPNNR